MLLKDSPSSYFSTKPAIFLNTGLHFSHTWRAFTLRAPVLSLVNDEPKVLSGHTQTATTAKSPTLSRVSSASVYGPRGVTEKCLENGRKWGGWIQKCRTRKENYWVWSCVWPAHLSTHGLHLCHVSESENVLTALWSCLPWELFWIVLGIYDSHRLQRPQEWSGTRGKFLKRRKIHQMVSPLILFAQSSTVFILIR